MGKAFDLTGSYQTLLSRLSLFTLVAASLMLFLPRYRTSPSPHQPAAALSASAGD
jgi:hypothetical protein